VLRAVSVGFFGVEWDDQRESTYGRTFTKQELTEWSIVPVGCNPYALAEGKRWGINTDPITKWFGALIDLRKEVGITPSEVKSLEQLIAIARKASAPAVSLPPRRVKAGRVLNAKNEQALRDAVKTIKGGIVSIQDVLASAAPIDEESAKDEDKQQSKPAGGGVLAAFARAFTNDRPATPVVGNKE
jgi:hypothetical protein